MRTNARISVDFPESSAPMIAVKAPSGMSGLRFADTVVFERGDSAFESGDSVFETGDTAPPVTGEQGVEAGLWPTRGAA